MVDKELLSRKISNLSYYISELKRAKDINWKKYTSDSRSRAFVERYLHLAIEEVFDIANHFVSFYRWREPTGYRDLERISRTGIPFLLIIASSLLTKQKFLPDSWNRPTMKWVA